MRCVIPPFFQYVFIKWYLVNNRKVIILCSFIVTDHSFIFICYFIFQADYYTVTGKPVVFCLRLKILYWSCSIAIGINLNFTAFDLRWWQFIIVVFSSSFAWLIS